MFRVVINSLALTHTYFKPDLNYQCRVICFQTTGIFSKDLNLIRVPIYRSPEGTVEVFLDKMEALFLFYSKPWWKNINIE